MVTGADGRCFGSLGVRVGTLPTWPVECMRAGIPWRPPTLLRGWRQVVFRTARVSLGWIASNGRGRRNVQM